MISAMASQITGISIVYPTVCSGADQRKHHSYSSLAFIARTHGCVRNDSETHETVLLDCTTGEAFITYIFCKNGIEMTFG